MGLHEGLVALHVEDDFGARTFPVRKNLSDSRGSVRAVDGGHANPTAKRINYLSNAGIVGGHHRRHKARHPFPDMLDHGLSGD